MRQVHTTLQTLLDQQYYIMSSSTTTDSSSITPSNLSVTAAVPNRTDDEDDESEALYIRQKTNKTLKILLIEMERGKVKSRGDSSTRS